MCDFTLTLSAYFCQLLELGAGVGFAVDLKEPFEVYVSIFLGCGQAFVTKKLLDRTKIRASAQKVGSKGVAEGVGADLPPHGRTLDILIDNPLD